MNYQGQEWNKKTDYVKRSGGGVIVDGVLTGFESDRS